MKEIPFVHLSVAGRIQQFDQRNGGKPVLFGEWYYYLNGAVREIDPLGLLQDPPENEYARLSNVVRFHQAHLNEAVRQFDAFKAQLWEPDAQALDHLKKLQAVVFERNAAVEQAMADLANTPEGQHRARARQYDSELQQRRASFRADVQSIRIKAED